MAKRRSRRDRIGGLARESAVLLVILGVFLILGTVVLINLDRPLVTGKTASVSESMPAEPAAPQPAPAPPAEEAPASEAPAQETPEPSAAQAAEPAAEPAPAPVVEPVAPPLIEPAPAAQPTPQPLSAPMSGFAPMSGAEIAILRSKDLLVPVAGVAAKQLRDTYGDGRSEGRMHEALDIMAASGTPVVAVADGMVMKLFQSAKGGITIYQADSSGQFVYYYAHLMRYADGIIEGKPVKRGEVIGYVGDTGNAGAGNYHLHFAIFKPTAPGKWSGGIPINPYPALGGK